MDELPTNVIEQLRAMMPVYTLSLFRRPISLGEAKLIAKRQSEAAIRLLGITKPSVAIELISELDEIDLQSLPPDELSKLAGAADRVDGRWVISLNEEDNLWEVRSTLAHEFKHILDDPFREILYPDWLPDTWPPPPEAEAVADYFMGNVLVRERWLVEAWQHGMRDVSDLASLFDVTEQLIETRIKETNLVTPEPWLPIDWHRYTRRKAPTPALLTTSRERWVKQPSTADLRAAMERALSIDRMMRDIDHYLRGSMPCLRGGSL